MKAHIECTGGASGDMILGAFAILSAKEVKRGKYTATKVDVITKPESKNRNFKDIVKLIKKAKFSKFIEQKSIAVFERLAVAESKVHGTTFEMLGITELTVSEFPLGSGTVKCAHGLLPVPVPAVVELVKGFPAHPGPIDVELLTPTGAAIITTLAKPGIPMDNPKKVGIGAGTKDFERLENVVKLS